jgi:cytoskeletal protein CcmA (bactofilin family)
MFSSNQTPTANKPTTSIPDRPERKPQREASNAPSIISSDVKITGNLLSPGEVQFDGQMEGDLTCGNLTVGERAEIDGTLTANRIVVHGSVKGSIRARIVHLHASARLVGDVVHEDLTVDSGAYIEGRCLHVNNPLENSKAPAQNQTVSQPAQNQPTSQPAKTEAPKPETKPADTKPQPAKMSA